MAVSYPNRRYLKAAGYGTRPRRTLIDSDLLLRLDWLMLGAVVGILLIGLMMIYSASRHLVAGDSTYFMKRQLLALGVGVLIAIVLVRIDYRKLRDYSFLTYIGTVLMLLFVVSPIGSNVKGHQAWFQLPFGFQLQPSELAKFGVVVALAGYVNEHRDDINPWRLTVLVALALIPVGLVQLQGDLGTNIVLIMAVIGLLAAAGVPGRYLLALTLLGATLIVAVVSLGLLQQYQLDRFTSLVGSGSKQTTAGYNQDQSTKTIGAGGVTGTGYLKGPQTADGFVPEQQTDFIFTAVGEELGFVGAATLLALFGILVWRTWRTARLAADFYGTLVCAGVLAIFAFQIFENIGMTMGIMPVAGIPLPFMSYGGSSLITSCACVALVANVYARRFD